MKNIRKTTAQNAIDFNKYFDDAYSYPSCCGINNGYRDLILPEYQFSLELRNTEHGNHNAALPASLWHNYAVEPKQEWTGLAIDPTMIKNGASFEKWKNYCDKNNINVFSENWLAMVIVLAHYGDKDAKKWLHENENLVRVTYEDDKHIEFTRNEVRLTARNDVFQGWMWRV